METGRAVRYFPRLRAGLGRAPGAEVQALCVAAFKLAVDGRAFIEDIEGAAEQPELLAVLRWRFADFLGELDLILRGTAPVDDWHHAALALEYGLSEVADLDGPTLASCCGLGDIGQGSESASSILAFWDGLLASFPGQLPDPLKPSGQGELLRALRNWNKLCVATQTPADFLQSLLQEV
jgi:hypothetical protein